MTACPRIYRFNLMQVNPRGREVTVNCTSAVTGSTRRIALPVSS